MRLVSSSPLDQSASYRAQGGLAAALAPDDSVELHLAGHDRGRARRRQGERGAHPLRRGAGPGPRAAGARRRVRHRTPRTGSRWDWKAATRGVASCTQAEARPAAGSRRRFPTAAVRDERITVHERCSALRLLVADGRCAGVVTDAGAMPAAATLLATGGAAALWRRTTNPRGAVGSGLLLALRRGRRAGRPRAASVPPDGAGRGGTARRLSRHRGSQGRGRAATDRGRRTVRRRARAARRRQPCDPRGARSQRAATS